jgi:hypothetical protein
MRLSERMAKDEEEHETCFSFLRFSHTLLSCFLTGLVEVKNKEGGDERNLVKI